MKPLRPIAVFQLGASSAMAKFDRDATAAAVPAVSFNAVLRFMNSIGLLSTLIYQVAYQVMESLLVH